VIDVNRFVVRIAGGNKAKQSGGLGSGNAGGNARMSIPAYPQILLKGLLITRWNST
jgi:hypothetical protein